MKELKPEDEEDKQNAIEYLETFGNLVTFLDGYSSDFTKLILRRREMNKLEVLAEQVGKSIDKMAKGVEDVGKAMDRLGDTINECEYEIVIPYFINDMVKDPKFKGRSDERLLLALNDDRNHFRALDISKKPEKDLTDRDKQFMKLFLRRTITFKEESREKIDKLYVEYYQKVKKLHEEDKKDIQNKQAELLLNDYKIRQNEAGEEYMKEIDDLKRQQVENEANERE